MHSTLHTWYAVWLLPEPLYLIIIQILTTLFIIFFIPHTLSHLQSPNSDTHPHFPGILVKSSNWFCFLSLLSQFCIQYSLQIPFVHKSLLSIEYYILFKYLTVYACHTDTSSPWKTFQKYWIIRWHFPLRVLFTHPAAFDMIKETLHTCDRFMKKTNPAERELNRISLFQVSHVTIIWPDSHFITWDLTYKINIIHSYFIHTQTPCWHLRTEVN